MRQNGYITITGNTRAKARALRDAVNIGVTALEELGGDDEGPPTKPGAKHGGSSTNGKPKGLATEDQKRQLKTLADVLYSDREEHLSGHEWLRRELGRPFGEFSEEQAKHVIARMEQRMKEDHAREEVEAQ